MTTREMFAEKWAEFQNITKDMTEDQAQASCLIFSACIVAEKVDEVGNLLDQLDDSVRKHL